MKYFVVTAFGAFLAHTLYRICRTTAGVPCQAIFYENAALKGVETDEFIVYREIIINISRFFLFLVLAGLLFIFPKLSITFIIAAIFSLGFILLGNLPKFKLRQK